MQNPNEKFKEGEVIPINTKCQYRVVDEDDERHENSCFDMCEYRHKGGDWCPTCPNYGRCAETSFHLKLEYFTEEKYGGVAPKIFAERTINNAVSAGLNKYERVINGAKVDIYDILSAYGVDCQAMGHGIKKALMSGKRGYKDSVQDKEEAISSIKRSIEMERSE